MKKFLNLAAAYPWSVLLVILLISLLAASQLHRLQIHVSPQELTIDNDPAKAFYERSVATFGSDDITLIFIRDQDLFGYDNLAAAVIMAYGAFSLRINNNILDYFEDGSPVKHQAMALHEKLSGMESFSIILNGDIEGTFLRARYLDEIVEIQRYIESSPDYDFSVSIADCLAMLNSIVNETGEAELPDDGEVLRELTNFVNPNDIKSYASLDYSQVRIVVRHNLGASYDLNRTLHTLRACIAENTDAGLYVNITGESVLTSKAADSMAEGQAKSLGLMLLVIFTVTSLLFLNVKAGLLATLSNLFPIVVLFGVMGYAGIPLDTGTSMIAAIALGICVDNTMHFMVRYNRELSRHKSEIAATEATMQGEARLCANQSGTSPDSGRFIGTWHVLGLSALVYGWPRTSTVVSLENTRVLALSWDSIQRGNRLYPRIVGHLFRYLSSILANRFAENELIPSPVPANRHALEAPSFESNKAVSALTTYANSAVFHG